MADYRAHEKDRPLRVGDRVMLTGTVVAPFRGNGWEVAVDNDCTWSALSGRALTRIEPVEPPVGSVVVKGGVAWTRMDDQFAVDLGQWQDHLGRDTTWADLSDGDVIHAGGDQ